MRAVLQRVSRAQVRVQGEPVASIRRGLVALVGVGQRDDLRSARELARKIVELRIFPDDQDRMNRSLLDVAGELCVVSQFTLHGDARKGRRPAFVEAAPGAVAEPLVEALIEAARALGVTVAAGRFGARMEVELVNDGPVTLLLDTERTF